MKERAAASPSMVPMRRTARILPRAGGCSPRAQRCIVGPVTNRENSDMACPACDRTGPGEEYEKLPGARIVTCPGCGLGRTDPVPAAALAPVTHYARFPLEEARRRLPLTRRYARPLV